MSITFASLGSNSFSITYTSGETVADIMSEFFTRIASYGWSVHDASAGTNAQTIKAACADATNDKFAYIDYNSTSGTVTYLKIQAYEDWNATTHTGTNLAQVTLSDSAQARTATDSAQQIDTTAGGTLYVMANARWLIVVSLVSAVYGDDWHNGWTGIIENVRTVPGDTAANGYPAFFWMNSGFILDHTLGTSTGIYCFSYPSLFDGSTGNNASARAIMMMPYLFCRIGPRQAITSSSEIPMMDGTDSLGNSIASPCLVAYGSEGFTVEYHGQCYGLTALPLGTGTWFDTAQVKFNASNLYDDSGTLTDCHILLGSQGEMSWAIPK